MRVLQLLLALVAAAALGGCDVVGTVFEVGMWVGIIIVVAIIALVGFIVSKFKR